MRQNQVVNEVDLMSLLLVGGSAAAVVILGLLIYRGVPPQKKAEVAQAPPAPVSLASVEKIPLKETKIAEEIRPPPHVFPVPVELIAEVSEAPPPFSEEPTVLRKRRTPRSAMPTDTTALNGISNDAGLGRVLVISAPKLKVRAYRNASTPSASPTRKRRSSPRNVGLPAVPETTHPAEEKETASHSAGIPQSSSQ